MSVVRLQRRLIRGWEIQLELLCDDPLLGGGIVLGLDLVWELCMSQSLSLHNLYIRSFNTTDGPWP